MALTSESYVVRTPGGPITLETVQYDKIGHQEILVETVAVSVCASDVKAAEGAFYTKPPMILGHEAAGIVRQVGPGVTRFRAGDKVVLHYSSCGSCGMCASGQDAYCDRLAELNFDCERTAASNGNSNGKGVGDGDEKGDDISGSPARETGTQVVASTADGLPLKPFFFGQSSMGRHALVRETSAVRVDATAEELRLFAALSCGVPTGAGAVINVCRPRPGAAFAIFGAGAVGLGAALAAGLYAPAEVIVVDTSQGKLDLVPPGVATATICSSGTGTGGEGEGAVAGRIRELMGRKGVDYAIDCAGYGAVVVEGCAALRPRGMVVSVGGSESLAPLGVDQMLIRGLTYRGTHQGDSVSQNFIPYLIGLWRLGKFPVEKLVSYYKMEELSQVLEDLKNGRVIKPVLIS